MSPTEHVKASTEPGPLGYLLWACTAVGAIVCSALALPWWVLLGAGIVVILCAWAIARMGALCDAERCIGCMDSQGRNCKCRDEMRDAFNADVEPWHLPHMHDKPNDAVMHMRNGGEVIDTTRRYPRTLNEAFPRTADAAASIHIQRRIWPW